MSRAALVLAGTTTLLALALAPAAQADPAVTCVDNKPAVGFSFTCDKALDVPPDDVAYPAPEGLSFIVGLPPPDSYSTLTLTSFAVPGFNCAILSSGNELGCSTPVAAGQTVNGTVSWKIGYSPHVPVGDCETGQLDGYTRDPGPGGESDLRMPPFALHACRSAGPATTTTTASKCKKKKKAHKRSAQAAKKKKCKKSKR